VTPGPPPPVLCAVCRRQHSSIGYVPPKAKGRLKPVWACLPDISLASTVFHMPRDRLTRIEEDALREAGEAGGQWLDEQGAGTDLAFLTPEQYQAYLAVVFTAYGEGMHRRLSSVSAPF